jgi:hypothetical protein
MRFAIILLAVSWVKRMLMGIKDFLAPTRGRIVLFVILFVLIFLYDTLFAPFPGSPVVDNLGTQEGATSFLLYILILPYILSCLLPAFAGLRKKRFWRLSSLREFMHPREVHHAQKPAMQQHFVFPSGTETVESKLPQASPQVPVQKPAGKPAPAKRAQNKTKPVKMVKAKPKKAQPVKDKQKKK